MAIQFLPLLPVIGKVSRAKRFATAVVPKFINNYFTNINRAIKQGIKPDLDRAMQGLMMQKKMVINSAKSIKNEADRKKAIKLLDQAIIDIKKLKVPPKRGRATQIVSREYEGGFKYTGAYKRMNPKPKPKKKTKIKRTTTKKY